MKKYFIFALAAAFAFVACQQDPEVKKDDESNQNQENQNQENQQGGQTDDNLMTTLCLNEVCGVVGSKGLELYNPTDAEISLEGVAIYKNEAADPTWTGDATSKIASKGYFVITSKKEFDNIADVANAKAADSFSPSKSLILVLKDKAGNVLDTFDRGWTKNGNAEVALPTAEGSFARTADAKKEWKVLDITIGKTNNGAKVIGEMSVDPE
jgi:hypothetical protein